MPRLCSACMSTAFILSPHERETHLAKWTPHQMQTRACTRVLGDAGRARAGVHSLARGYICAKPAGTRSDAILLCPEAKAVSRLDPVSSGSPMLTLGWCRATPARQPPADLNPRRADCPLATQMLTLIWSTALYTTSVRSLSAGRDHVASRFYAMLDFGTSAARKAVANVSPGAAATTHVLMSAWMDGHIDTCMRKRIHLIYTVRDVLYKAPPCDAAYRGGDCGCVTNVQLVDANPAMDKGVRVGRSRTYEPHRHGQFRCARQDHAPSREIRRELDGAETPAEPKLATGKRKYSSQTATSTSSIISAEER